MSDAGPSAEGGSVSDVGRHANDAPVIAVEGIVTRFGENTVHDGVSFSVERGTLAALIGGSGTGKSVLLREIIGLHRPSAGSVRVLGTDMWRAPAAEVAAVRRRFGMTFQDGALFSSLTVAQNVAVPLAEHTAIAPPLRDEIVRLRLAQAGLHADAGPKLPSELSGGMRKRAALARALALEPEILFLDEPTSGLDPFGRRLVRDIIHDQRAQGTAIFLNSHILSEIEVTCDRVAFIKQGQIVRTASLEELAEGEFSVEVRAHPLTPEIITGLEHWARHINTESEHLHLTLSHEHQIPEINRFLVARGVDVFAIRPQRISLEDLFVQIMEKDEGY